MVKRLIAAFSAKKSPNIALVSKKSAIFALAICGGSGFLRPSGYIAAIYTRNKEILT